MCELETMEQMGVDKWVCGSHDGGVAGVAGGEGGSGIGREEEVGG